MASNFSSLRSARQAAIEHLNSELKKEASGKADDRFWKLTIDPKTKIGYATIRFLPEPKNEQLPWVKLFSHAFQFNGSWFIENCPTTNGQVPCPVCKNNTQLWNSGNDANKKIASARKRKTVFISNILVVNDPAHPENNGKVFLFKYGVKLQEKIQDVINPPFPDTPPGNPFDFWTGRTFKLKASPQGDFVSYEKSAFEDPSELGNSDEDREAIWTQEHSLIQFVAADQIKSYEDLETRFNNVLTGKTKPTAADEIRKETEATAEDAKAVAAEVKRTSKKKDKPAPTPSPAPETSDDLEDFFKEVLED